MKKFILIVLTILLLTGLYFRFVANDESSKKTKSTKEEQVVIQANDIYKQPDNPTKYEGSVYNKLTSILNDNSSMNNSETTVDNSDSQDETTNEETPISDNQTTSDNQTNQDASTTPTSDDVEQNLAIQVAKSFACDLFTLTSEDFAAPSSYVLKDNREDFEKYTKSVLIPNYRNIVEEYGEDNLPQVKNITVENVQKANDAQYGPTYTIALKLTYKKSEVDVNSLKQNATIKLVQYENNWYVLSIK